MTLRISTGLSNFITGIGSLKQGLNGGRMEIYGGAAQPASADLAVTGTLLATLTNNSGALTNEVLASATINITGASGSITAVTVNGVEIMGGAVAYLTSPTVTAALVAAQINNNQSPVEYFATSSGAIVTITALPGTGVNPNAFTFTVTSTLTNTASTTMTGGVAGVNGLKYSAPSAGVIATLPGQVWSGVNVASGTAYWFRIYGSVADVGAQDTNFIYNRMDGAVASVGAEMNAGTSTNFAAGATTSITSWSAQLPTS